MVDGEQRQASECCGEVAPVLCRDRINSRLFPVDPRFRPLPGFLG
jgi:hypothetical protein